MLADDTMRVGLSVAISGGPQYTPTEILDLARAADRLGFDTLWHSDHVVVPLGYTSDHPPVGDKPGPSSVLGPSTKLVDPHIVLAAVSAVTERLRLGTAVTVGPMYQPLMLARTAQTLSLISGGRFALGLGAGWLSEEFEALGSEFRDRGNRLDEIVAILRRSFAGGPFSAAGPHYPFERVQLSPEPTHVEIVIGGNSPPALRRAARLGDAWFTSGAPTFEHSMELRDRVLAERRALGVERPFRCYMRVPEFDGATVDRHWSRGVSDLVVLARDLWPPGASDDEKLHRIASAADLLNLASPSDRRHSAAQTEATGKQL